jgi:hypothetical protein
MSDPQPFRWTQPQCDDCWEHSMGDKPPTRLVEAQDETCATCGVVTTSGIYIRVDPTTVPFPSLLKP